jgi:cobalt-zinc-cadmium efflux system protein
MTTHASHVGHLPATSDTRALAITGWLTGIYFVIELGIGFWTGSISVISDAFHTFSAIGGVLIALVAGHYAKREADQFQSYGLIRAEIVGALLNGLFLVGMALLVLWMGAMRLQHPIHLPTGPMFLVALGGLITEFIAIGLLYQRQKGNLNLKGAFWHILQTFVGSLIIIVSALVIRFTGFLAIDPILGMVFGLVLLWASWGIIRDSLHILLERTPEGLDLNAALVALKAMPGVKDVHHVHAWSLTSGKNIFSAHVCISDASQHERILRDAYQLLKEKFGIYFSTLQIEETCLDEVGAEAIDITKTVPSSKPSPQHSIH